MPGVGGTLYRRTPERVSANPIHGPRSQPLSLRANQCREADLADWCAAAPDESPGLSCFSGSAGRVGVAGAVAAPALEPAEVDRVVEVDVTEGAAEQLQRVARERVGVLLVDAQLLRHPARSLGEARSEEGGRSLGRGERGEGVVQASHKLLVG